MISLPFVPSNPIVDAIKALYGVASAVNTFIDEHIEQLKKHTNETISATGRVLEGAKFGFGIGYITPLVLTATGQLLLGNNLAATSIVASGLTLSNPLAMTCAAIGAIYYGWQALTEDEKNAILNRLTQAFEVGAELIKSMIAYVISSLGTMLSKEKIAEFKNFIASAAENFGKTLSDITRDIKDKFFHVMNWVGDAFSEASTTVKEGAERTKESVKETFEKMTKKSD
jgi:uncharacterized membrane protein